MDVMFRRGHRVAPCFELLRVRLALPEAKRIPSVTPIGTHQRSVDMRTRARRAVASPGELAARAASMAKSATEKIIGILTPGKGRNKGANEEDRHGGDADVEQGLSPSPQVPPSSALRTPGGGKRVSARAPTPETSPEADIEAASPVSSKASPAMRLPGIDAYDTPATGAHAQATSSPAPSPVPTRAVFLEWDPSRKKVVSKAAVGEGARVVKAAAGGSKSRPLEGDKENAPPNAGTAAARAPLDLPRETTKQQDAPSGRGMGISSNPKLQAWDFPSNPLLPATEGFDVSLALRGAGEAQRLRDRVVAERAFAPCLDVRDELGKHIEL